MLVEERMTKNPITIPPETSVHEAGMIMRRNHFHRLPVVDGNGHLIGFLLDRDILKVSPSPATSLAKYEVMELLNQMKVADIMKKDVPTINPEASIEEAAYLMYTKNVNGLPVISSVGAVVGILTERDLFKCFVDMMGLSEGRVLLTINVEDRTGLVRDVTAIIAGAGYNINSLSACQKWDGRSEVNVRVAAKDAEAIVKLVNAAGFNVTYTAKIGQ